MVCLMKIVAIQQRSVVDAEVNGGVVLEASKDLAFLVREEKMM